MQAKVSIKMISQSCLWNSQITPSEAVFQQPGGFTTRLTSPYLPTNMLESSSPRHKSINDPELCIIQGFI